MARASHIPLPPLPRAEAPAHAVVLATVIRNEERYLAEWIDFHRFLGVGHFYFYDNGSTDGGGAALAPYLERGLATVIPWRLFDTGSNMQTMAYAHALANFGGDCRWMGFFDVDEFVFALSGDKLPETLARYADLAALAVVGVQFGTSGHVAPPEGLVIENYRRSAPIAAYRRHPKLLNTKCFVQPSGVAAAASAHYFRLRGTKAVGFTENRAPLFGMPRRQPAELTADVIRYNHYFTRSRSEFDAKRARGSVRGPTFRIGPDDRQAMFEAIEDMAQQDRAIDVHLHAFKAWLAAEKTAALAGPGAPMRNART